MNVLRHSYIGITDMSEKSTFCLSQTLWKGARPLSDWELMCLDSPFVNREKERCVEGERGGVEGTDRQTQT